MKPKSVLSLLGLLLALVARAQPADTWVNWGVITAPPDVAPQIDALNFVNSNSISIIFTNFTTNPELFDTSDTLNFTNVGFMSSDAGWQFDTAPVLSGLRHPALSIYNSGTILAGSAPIINVGGQGIGGRFFGFNFFGGAQLFGFADSIFNSGTMQVGIDGLLKLTGGDLSLSRSALNIEGSGSGIFDDYWGASTNVTTPSIQFAGPFPFTSSHTVTQLFDHTYFTFQTSISLGNHQTWVNDFTIGTNRTVQIVLLSQPNPAISNNVYFFGSEISVEWIAFATNPVTGDTITNYLNLFDAYLDPPTTNNYVTQNHVFPGNLFTYIPTNFFLFQGPFFTGLTPASPSSISGVFANDQSRTVTNQYGAYRALILPFSAPTNDVTGRSVTNLSGRIELTASRVLDLNRTRMADPNVVSLKSTNHFAGNEASQIAAAFWDLDLATTNSSIAITNLLMPLPRLNGNINFYRARWTNQTDLGFVTNTSVYHVLFVDNQLNTIATPQVFDFYLRNSNNTDVVISDEVDVMRNFRINARNLTLTSNDFSSPFYPRPFYPFGSINFQNSSVLWSTALPNLRNLTNHGLITIQNAAFFGGQRTSPFISSGPGDWYDSFINDGVVSVQGLTIYSRYFNNSGFLDSGVGPLTVYSLNASITNGTLFAANSSIGLYSGTLLTSNSVLVAGGPITLSITNLLDDGSLANCVQFVTNRSVWIGSGFNLLNLPPLASLLATTVTNTSLAYVQVFNKWAAADKGTDPSGYVNNAAVGQLILDGGHPDSLFTFQPATGNNAIYVDNLELKDYTTNNANNVYYGVDIQPGMLIYYAQATANGVSIAEKLNGANNGRFRWVSNYNCGFFSSVTLTDPATGSNYTMNAALRISPNIDSDNDGIINRDDPSPLGDSVPVCNCPPFILPPFVTGDNSGFTPGQSTNVFSGPPVLSFPGPVSRSGDPIVQTFSDVKGSYAGLFSDTNGVTPASAGYFTASTTAKGAISAKLVLGGRSYAFSGAFNSSGMATGKIARGALHSLNLRLQLDLAGGNQITGSLSDSHWTSQIVANRLLFDKTRNPAAQFVGNYTLNFPGDAPGHDRPSGDGFGTVKIDAAGNVQFAGSLADGSKLTQKSLLSSSGLWPLYVSLYQGSGCGLGWLEIVNHRLAGQFVWIKPAALSGSAAKSYPTGFTNRIDTAGLTYHAPSVGQQILDWNYGRAILTSGGLAGFSTNSIYLDLPKHQFISDNPSLKLTITPGSGLFQGSVLNPDTGKSLKFQGALFQDINVGLGYFLNSDQSGQIYLGPLP
jgi:hypothetical protein